MKKLRNILGVMVLSMMVFITGVNAATVDESKAPDKVFIGWDANVDVEVREDVFYVTLTGDIKQDLIIEDGEVVVLDLAGNKFENFTLATEAIKVEKGGELTIIDSVGTGVVTHQEGSTYGPITNLGTLTIEGGNYEINDSFYVVRNEGTATIKGGTFTSTSTDTSLIGNIRYVDKTVTPVLTIEDGTFTAISNTVKNNPNSEITINGGTFTSENAFALENNGVAVVNGGELTSTNNSAIRTTINSDSETSLKVANTAVLSSSADKADYTIYDATLAADVTEDYDVTLDEDGNVVFTEKEEVETPTEPETPSEPVVENPSTSDNVLTYMIIGVISLLGIASASLYLKKRIN